MGKKCSESTNELGSDGQAEENRGDSERVLSRSSKTRQFTTRYRVDCCHVKISTTKQEEKIEVFTGKHGAESRGGDNNG